MMNNDQLPPSNPVISSFKQVFSVLRWILLLVVLGVILSLSIKTLIPATPEAGNLFVTESAPPSAPAETTEKTHPSGTQDDGYDWRGGKLLLKVPLPESPAEAKIYILQPEVPATLEQAQELAKQFGIQGEVYLSSGRYPAYSGYYLITDGKQSLSVNSSLYFTYTADMAKAYNRASTTSHSNAEATIRNFLQKHGLEFPYKLEPTELYGGSFAVEPLSPDGFPTRYEYFSSRPMLITLDDNGLVLQLDANLINYDSAGGQTYGILSAEEAFQKLLDDSTPAGKIESVHTPSSHFKEWRYTYPRNETITIYGYVSSVPSMDPGKPPFMQIDGYTVTGNTGGIDASQENIFVEATGQFITENGIEKFQVDSWKPSEFQQDGLVGTLRREKGQVIFYSPDIKAGQLILNPDVPVNLPLPFENAFVLGVAKGNIYEWTLIDDRMTANRGGGGGGGGVGFYKPNLSGSPVPFPTATIQPALGDGEYVVKEGDTLASIGMTFGVSIQKLIEANGLTSDGLISVGQTLIIPGAQTDQSMVGTRLEGQRGLVIVNIYNQSDGSQRVEHVFAFKTDTGWKYGLLEGKDLQGLQSYHNRPINIWGTISRMEQNGFPGGTPVVSVERHEVPFPDLQFQIVKGIQKQTQIDGKNVILFTADNGTTYIQMSAIGDPFDNYMLLDEEEPVLLEALIIPDDTFSGYPGLRSFSAGLAISPKNGQAVELPITADQPNIMDGIPTDELAEAQSFVAPSLTIEDVELIYYVTNQRWQVDHLEDGTQYLQPAWRFSGHYDNGDEFDVLIQALQQEYLLPELAPYIQSG